MSFVDFSQATFRAGSIVADKPRGDAGLLGSVVHGPAIFRRNDVEWAAVFAWRSAVKAADLALSNERNEKSINSSLARQVS
jgi:hypothetical protein